IAGAMTHRRYKGINQLKIEGSSILRNLPDTGVLFIYNHQTYFADVVAMLHVLNESLKVREDKISNSDYVCHDKLNIYFIAAKESMKSGLLPRIMAYAGSISVERTWRAKGQDIVDQKKEVNPNDTENIGIALEDGWVITFPQGTTKSFKPIR